jgi:hypothetical protein
VVGYGPPPRETFAPWRSPMPGAPQNRVGPP